MESGMIDTLGLYASLTPVERAPFVRRLGRVKSRPGGFVTGELEGIRVALRPGGYVSATCSVPKLVQGHNAADLPVSEMAVFVEERVMGDPILRRATITRLDVAGLAYLRHLPTRYLRCLGTKPHWRHATDYHVEGERYDSEEDELSSRTYRTGEVSYVVYDKGMQLERETGCIAVEDPDDPLSCRHLLKLELQLKRRVGYHALDEGGRKFLPADLLDPSVLLGLARRWREAYLSIAKLRPKVDLGRAKTPKEIERELVRAGLAALGAETVNASLRSLGSTNPSIKRSCLDKWRALRELSAEGPSPDDPIAELDAEVERIYASFAAQIEAYRQTLRKSVYELGFSAETLD
jgi:hypothetical protein